MKVLILVCDHCLLLGFLEYLLENRSFQHCRLGQPFELLELIAVVLAFELDDQIESAVDAKPHHHELQLEQ